MLTKDQRERLKLLKTMKECPRQVAIDALEQNYWDTSMAFEWIKYQEEHENPTIEEFHASYEEARKQSVVLPQDRYDIPDKSAKAAPVNRKERRQQMKAEKKNKKKKK